VAFDLEVNPHELAAEVARITDEPIEDLSESLGLEAERH
jgi:hypothetical protein